MGETRTPLARADMLRLKGEATGRQCWVDRSRFEGSDDDERLTFCGRLGGGEYTQEWLAVRLHVGSYVENDTWSYDWIVRCIAH